MLNFLLWILLKMVHTKKRIVCVDIFVTTFDDAGIDDLKEMLYFRRLNAFNRSIQNLQESGTTYTILRVDYLL